MFGRIGNCSCAHPEGNVQHIINDCTIWDHAREQYFTNNWKGENLKEPLQEYSTTVDITIITKDFKDLMPHIM